VPKQSQPLTEIATSEPVLSTMRFFASLRMTTSEGTHNDMGGIAQCHKHIRHGTLAPCNTHRGDLKRSPLEAKAPPLQVWLRH
jgi:hypothetical protein